MEDKNINLIVLIILIVMLSFLVVMNTEDYSFSKNTNCYGTDNFTYILGNSSYLTNGTLTMILTVVSVTSSGKICYNDNCTSPED